MKSTFLTKMVFVFPRFLRVLQKFVAATEFAYFRYVAQCDAFGVNFPALAHDWSLLFSLHYYHGIFIRIVSGK